MSYNNLKTKNYEDLNNVPWTKRRSLAELAYPPTHSLQLQQLRPSSAEMTALGATILFSVALVKMIGELRCGAAAIAVGVAAPTSYVPARLGALDLVAGVPGYVSTYWIRPTLLATIQNY